MNLNLRSTAFAALSAAFLFLGAASTKAQTSVVATAHGSHLASNKVDTLHFMFFVAKDLTGSAQGFGVWSGSQGTTIFKVDSLMFIGDTLLFAGPIVRTLGTPPPGHEVGATAFTAVKDNGRGSPDETTSLSVVPKRFGNPTIQQIIALLGGGPTPAHFRPLLTGNIRIH
jgi:hypothetical protein